MPEMPDYYTLLEVAPSATSEEIKRSYRRLARLHHPDLNAQARDTHIKRLNAAYSVLSNPQKRAVYDAQLQEARLRSARRAQEQARKQEPRMTWAQGIAGFVRELKKELRED